MGRSKAAGKPVEELSLDDLRRERVRCQVLSEIYPERSAKACGNGSLRSKGECESWV